MIEATFIASGKTMQEALNFTASLVNKIMFEDESFRQVKKIDIFCNNIDDANLLDNILWEKPKYSIVSHSLVNNSSDDLIEIGYPGTKFNLEANSLINLSPDLPKNLDGYENYFQLVVMDGSDLRERAAKTWTECKKLGIKASFIESA